MRRRLTATLFAFALTLTAGAQIGFPNDPPAKVPPPPGIMVIDDEPHERGVSFDSSKKRKPRKGFEFHTGVIRRVRNYGNSKTVDHYHYDTCGKKVRHGPYETWRRGKRTLRGYYAAGKKTSQWTEYFGDGTVRQTYGYIAGKKTGPSTIWQKAKGKSGRWQNVKHMVHHYANGKRNGTYTSWWSNGQVHEQGQYKNHKKVGPWRSFHRNGLRWAEVTYVNDRRHGTKQVWSSKGKLLKVEHWVNGKKQ